MSIPELVARLAPEEIGGAKVFRQMTLFGKVYVRGELVPVELLRKVPKQNLRALMDQRFIVVWPIGEASPQLPTGDDEVFVYNRPGTSRYDVIVGRRLNHAPLSKTEADKLAKEHGKDAAA